MWSPWLLAILLLSFSGVSLSARMLALLVAPTKSHFLLQFSVLKVLAERGHQVEMYSYFPLPSPVENISHKLLKNDVIDGTDDNVWTFKNFKEFCNKHYFGFWVQRNTDSMLRITKEAFQHEHIQNLLNSNDTFDLVFMEAMVQMESLALFSHKFKAPIVNFNGIGDWIPVDWMSGNSLSVAHIPDRRSFGFTHSMSFMERFRNAVSTAQTLLHYHMILLPSHQHIIKRYYKDPTTPHISDLLKNIALTFTNDCPTLGYPRPYTPNIIPIGGAHISTHMTPLPQDVMNFMNDATEGVIFFSLGTIVPLHIFPEEYLKSFLNTFKKLSVKVLWKTKLQSLPGLPENVKLVKWVPQPSVLAHPNCRLFITHGGLMSQHEVLHVGVPVVAIPFFSDQHYNVGFYEYLGVGVKLEFSALSEDSVFKAVTTVLNDTRYKQNAEKMSRIVRDQPMSPMDSAVYWVEYVLRHRDTQHLRPVSAELYWYKQNAEKMSRIVRDQPMSPMDSAVYWVEYVLRHRDTQHLRPVSAELRWYKQNAEKMSRIVRDQPMSPMDSAVYWVEYVLRHRDTQHLRPVSAELRWYKQNAEKMSRIVRDQPMSPMDLAVYWVEYVLRHRDTQHLRPVSAELRWYQLWLLDVAAAMFISLLLTLLALYKIIRWTLNFFCKRSRTLVSSDKKRK